MSTFDWTEKGKRGGQGLRGTKPSSGYPCWAWVQYTSCLLSLIYLIHPVQASGFFSTHKCLQVDHPLLSSSDPYLPPSIILMPVLFQKTSNIFTGSANTQ